MKIGKMIYGLSMVGGNIYIAYRMFTRQPIFGATVLMVLFAFLGLIIYAANDDDLHYSKKHYKGFDKEAFERYQHYLIATNKKK